MPFTIDIDTGGTFTDGFITDARIAHLIKVPTTPHDLTVCFTECIEAAAARAGLPLASLLRQTEVIRYSTTVGTNALIQKTGPCLGLMVTAGSEAALAGHPLIDPQLVAGLPEAVDATGKVTAPLPAAGIKSALEQLLDRGAEALCVSLRHSELNPMHERQVKAVVAAEYPPHYLGCKDVFAASDVSIRPGYQERTNAAILTGYLHGQVAAYLYKAEDWLRENGYRHGLLVVHNSGGVARVLTSTALNTYGSGPVAGLFGAARLAQTRQRSGVILTMDIGGTSLDSAILTGPEIGVSPRAMIHDMPVNVPICVVESFGIGGGSIARVTGGRLEVGPQSAGAVPGPAAFDLGGTEPTVTDADLVAGRLSADGFMGGRRSLSVERARAALAERVAIPLGLSVEAAAGHVLAAATEKIAGILRTQLADQGIDPARVVLYAFGGGSGLRAGEVGQALGVRQVLTSPFGSVFCAQGSALMDVMHLYEAPLGAAPPADTRQTLAARAVHDLAAAGFPAERIAWSETVEHDPIPILRLRATCPIAHFDPVPVAEGGPDATAAHQGSRPVLWGRDWQETPVFDRDRLRPGHQIRGPALVDGGDTVIAVAPGLLFRVDAYGDGILAALPATEGRRES